MPKPTAAAMTSHLEEIGMEDVGILSAAGLREFYFATKTLGVSQAEREKCAKVMELTPAERTKLADYF